MTAAQVSQWPHPQNYTSPNNKVLANVQPPSHCSTASSCCHTYLTTARIWAPRNCQMETDEHFNTATGTSQEPTLCWRQAKGWHFCPKLGSDRCMLRNLQEAIESRTNCSPVWPPHGHLRHTITQLPLLKSNSLLHISGNGGQEVIAQSFCDNSVFSMGLHL